MSTTTSAPPTRRPNLSEDEIDDLLYFARTGGLEEFNGLWNALCEREKVDFGGLLELAVDGQSGNGVIHMGAGNGHLEFISQMLRTLSTPIQNPLMLSLVNAPNKAGNTPMHWAAMNGHLECVKALMEGGADPLVRNGVGHDAVFEAEVNGKSEVVEWALREGGEGMEVAVGGGGQGGVEAEAEGHVGDDEEGGEEEVEVMQMSMGDLSVEDGKGEGDVKGKGRKGNA